MAAQLLPLLVLTYTYFQSVETRKRWQIKVKSLIRPKTNIYHLIVLSDERKYFRNTISMPNRLDPDQDHCFVGPGREVIKLFACSTQLSTKFQPLIKTKIPSNKDVSSFKSLRCCIYHAYKC